MVQEPNLINLAAEFPPLSLSLSRFLRSAKGIIPANRCLDLKKHISYILSSCLCIALVCFWTPESVGAANLYAKQVAYGRDGFLDSSIDENSIFGQHTHSTERVDILDELNACCEQGLLHLMRGSVLFKKEQPSAIDSVELSRAEARRD